MGQTGYGYGNCHYPEVVHTPKDDSRTKVSAQDHAPENVLGIHGYPAVVALAAPAEQSHGWEQAVKSVYAMRVVEHVGLLALLAGRKKQVSDAEGAETGVLEPRKRE